MPNGLADFIEPLTRQGLCRMSIQQHASGLWTVYMSDDEPSQIIEVRECFFVFVVLYSETPQYQTLSGPDSMFRLESSPV